MILQVPALPPGHATTCLHRVALKLPIGCWQYFCYDDVLRKKLSHFEL